jgi:Family of unknown function (DUF6515)
MSSITRLAFTVTVLGATTLSIAGQPAFADQEDPEHPAEVSVHHAVPLFSPLSPDAIDVMSNGRLYWYDNGLWYADENSVVTATHPPAGIVVPKLPPMYATGAYGDGTPYYYAQGVYYERAERGYVVTQAPDFSHGSQAIRAASPANPVRGTTTTSERAKRFSEQERDWQQLSTP